jgi:RNA polymerase sigma factor (sigma-70 family)
MPEHLVDLTDALARLSDRARSVVVLRSYVGLPDDEIGRVLGCTAVTVRVIFHRAMVGLREVIR